MILEYMLYYVTFDVQDLVLNLYCRSLKFGCTELWDKLSSVIPQRLSLTWVVFHHQNCIQAEGHDYCVPYFLTSVSSYLNYSLNYFYMFWSWFSYISYVRLNSSSPKTIVSLKMFFFPLNFSDTKCSFSWNQFH